MNKLFLPIFLFLSILIISDLAAQLPRVYYGELETEGKNLIVVVDESVLGKSFTSHLQEVMNEEWKLTPFKILSTTTFTESAKTYQEDPNNIFMSFNLILFDEHALSTLQMLIGNEIRKNGRVISLLSSTSKYAFTCSQFSLAEPIKASLVKDITIIQKVIRYQHNKSDYNIPDPIIKNRTLYINKERLFTTTAEDIKEVYPYPFKVVSSAEYYRALLQKDPQLAFTDIVRTRGLTFLCIFTMDQTTPLLWSQPVKSRMNLHFKLIAEKLEGK